MLKSNIYHVSNNRSDARHIKKSTIFAVTEKIYDPFYKSPDINFF